MDQTNIKYIGLNRRLMSAMIDLFIVTIIVFPLMYPINSLIFGDRTIEAILSELSIQHGDNISSALLVDTLIANNYFPKYIFSQLILLTIIAFYTISFWYKFGATPGKYLCGCRLVDSQTYKTLSLPRCIMRFICYVISALPLFLGFFMIDFNKSKKGLHDKICNTSVIDQKVSFDFLKSLRFPFFSKQK